MFHIRKFLCREKYLAGWVALDVHIASYCNIITPIKYKEKVLVILITKLKDKLELNCIVTVTIYVH